MRVSLVLVACLLVGCTSAPELIVVDDVTAGAKAGYSIELVDGGKPTRRDHPFITYVPFVMVTPGTHRLLLVRDLTCEDKARPERVTVDMGFEPGVSYELSWSGKTVVVIPSPVGK